VYNRPFDDQSQARIRLEAEAFLSILEKNDGRCFSIISSSVLAYENSLSPFPERKERISNYVALASRTLKMTDAIRKEQPYWKRLVLIHLMPCILPVLIGGAEYFITCDDNIIRKARKERMRFHCRYAVPLNF